MLTLSLPRMRYAALTVAFLAGAASAPPALADRYSEAVAHVGRTPADLKRDEIDHPAEVLRLAGIRPGMAVADLLAADGYYSELLSYIVGPRGHVYLLNNTAYDQWSDNQWDMRLLGGRLPNVEHRTIDVQFLGFPAHSIDAILLIKVYHDLYWQPNGGPWPKIDPDAVLTEIARVVRPGGILLLVDHSAQPGTGSSQAGTLHRIDENFARRDFEKHGFVLVARSNVLRRPDDPRTLITYQGEMLGKTDRFVMVFRRVGTRHAATRHPARHKAQAAH
jgi:predicted methyltransferase